MVPSKCIFNAAPHNEKHLYDSKCVINAFEVHFSRNRVFSWLPFSLGLSLRSSTSDTWSNRLVESSNRFLNKIWPTMWPHEVDSVVFTQKPYRDCLAEVCRQKLLATHLRRATYFAVVAIAFEIGKYFGSCPQN